MPTIGAGEQIFFLRFSMSLVCTHDRHYEQIKYSYKLAKRVKKEKEKIR
jgi:hypothetical protein